MTKKDYNLIARAFLARQMAYTEEKTTEEKTIEYIEYIAQDLAYLLGKTDPKFDKDKFLQACGITAND